MYIFCNKCGAENTIDAKYCQECGNEIINHTQDHTQKGMEDLSAGQYSNTLDEVHMMNTLGDKAQKAANIRDSIIAAHPEEFGFEVIKL